MTYSHRDFTGRTLVEASDLLNCTVVGSCFSQENPDTIVFPDGMTGVDFTDCNLDNCVIPPGNAVINCSVRRFMAQADGHDWEVDENNQPLRILGS